MTAAGAVPAPSRRGSILVSAALGAALIPLNSTMVAVALPALSGDFGADPAAVTISVVTGYLIATLVLQLPAGSVADRVGYGRALVWGRWIFTGGALAAAFAPALWAVVAGRLLMAAGGAFMVPTAMALVRVAVPAGRRSRAFGAMGAVMSGAAALGPALGAWMAAELGWRSLFLVNLPLLALAWLLQPAVPAEAEQPREQPREGRRPFDWAGSALLGTALVLLTLATRAGLSLAVPMAAAGAVAVTFLLLHERKAPAPVLDLSLFAREGFAAGAGVIAAQNLAMYSLLIQIPFLFGGLGSKLGLAIIAMTATMAVTSPLGGWLGEALGPKPVVLAGGLLGATGVVLLTGVPPSAGATEVGLPLLLVGLAVGLSSGPSQAAALTAVPPRKSGVAWATVSMMRYLGGIGGTVILGFALSAGTDSPLGQARALWIFAAAFLVSGALGLLLPPLSAEAEVQGEGAAVAG